MNYYPLLIALGLLFLAASFLVTHSTGRSGLILSCVAFLIAAILTVIGTAGVPGG